jgi:hypothetical protein
MNNNKVMKEKFLWMVLIYLCLATAGARAQTENTELKKLEGIWIPDSLYVGEIAKDKTETPIDSNTIRHLDLAVFTKLDLRSGKNCILNRKQIEISHSSYDITEGGQLQFECEETLFHYRYQLAEYLTLEGDFIGITADGIIMSYRVFMRFKRQSDK